MPGDNPGSGSGAVEKPVAIVVRMAEHPRTAFPAAALDHLAGPTPGRVLALEGPATVAIALSHRGHRVFGVDRDPSVARRFGHSGPIPRVTARTEALPFDPCQFDAVVAHQSFHRFNPRPALSEMARVLRPGGHAAISYLVRDDTVPWVRRLAALLRSVDPDAMRGDYGDSTAAALLSSKYFPEHDTRTFRVWVPMSRRELLAMVGSQPRIVAAGADRRARLLHLVGDLFDDTTGGLESVRLPYQLKVWRGFVDHDELTASIDVASDALVIRF